MTTCLINQYRILLLAADLFLPFDYIFTVQTKSELLKKAELKRKEAVKQQEVLINSKQELLTKLIHQQKALITKVGTSIVCTPTEGWVSTGPARRVDSPQVAKRGPFALKAQ